MFNKKGALTTRQIILLVILLVSFAVILFFLFRMDLGGESKKQVCRNSVQMKANSAVPEGSQQLNCKRTYICITKDGNCEMNNPKEKKVSSLEEVHGILAKEMADCWWMFGEGKVNYIGDKALKKNYCSICSQVYFDDSLNELEGVEGGKINKDEFYEYLTKHNVSGSKMSYSEYLLGTNDLDKLKQQAIKQTASSNEEISESDIGDISFGNIKLGEEYYVMTGIISEISVGWKIAGGAAIVAGTFFTGGTLGYVLIGGGVASIGTGEVAGLIEPEIGAIIIEGRGGVDNDFMAPTIQEVKTDSFEELNCEEVINRH